MTSKQYEAVIFDLDGTLIDSMWLWEQIDIDYLKRFDLELPEESMESDLEGMSFTETATYFKTRFDLPDTIEQIKATWNEMAYDYYMTKVPLKSNVTAFLELLHSKGIKIGIATSNNRPLVEAVIKRHNIEHYFSSIRTSCEVEKGKPHPFVYLKVAEDLGVAPEKCLVFEDVPNGIRGARKAGMSIWGVEDRQHETLKETIKALADRYILDYKEAIDFFNEEEE